MLLCRPTLGFRPLTGIKASLTSDHNETKEVVMYTFPTPYGD